LKNYSSTLGTINVYALYGHGQEYLELYACPKAFEKRYDDCPCFFYA